MSRARLILGLLAAGLFLLLLGPLRAFAQMNSPFKLSVITNEIS